MGCSSSSNVNVHDNVKSPHFDLDEYHGVINWIDIKPNRNYASSESALGSGGFGVVIKGFYCPQTLNCRQIEVAIKVVTKNQILDSNEYQKLIYEMNNFVSNNRMAEEKVILKSCITHVYGICNGPIPIELSTLFQLQVRDEGIGIVMRLEQGGSLESLIHPEDVLERKSRASVMLNMKIKIMIIFQIARAIAELHSVGIVHGDLKPDNILFDKSINDTTFNIRLSDFGSAKIKDMTLGESSIQHTKSNYGTMHYNPPEMFSKLIDDSTKESNNNNDGKKVKPSRKTDMYAFAIIVWEILSEERAYKKILSEPALGIHLLKNRREDLSQLPDDTPTVIKNIITDCWSTDRRVRKSAIECCTLLHPLSVATSNVKHADVLIDIQNIDLPKNIIGLIYYHFIRHGLTVLYEDHNTEISKYKIKICSHIVSNVMYANNINKLCKTKLYAYNSSNDSFRGNKKSSIEKITSFSSLANIASFMPQDVDISFLWSLAEEFNNFGCIRDKNYDNNNRLDIVTPDTTEITSTSNFTEVNHNTESQALETFYLSSPHYTQAMLTTFKPIIEFLKT